MRQDFQTGSRRANEEKASPETTIIFIKLIGSKLENGETNKVVNGPIANKIEPKRLKEAIDDMHEILGYLKHINGDLRQNPTDSRYRVTKFIDSTEFSVMQLRRSRGATCSAIRLLQCLKTGAQVQVGECLPVG